MSFTKRLGRTGRPLRIGYGRIFHEACAFSPLVTTRADFERTHHVTGAALAEAAGLRGTELKSFFPHAELTGFVQAARLAGGVEAVPLSSSLAVPSGPLTKECFEWLLDTLLGELARAGTLDGVYLALHGSMEVQGLGEAPEAVILRRVRETVGPGPKIAASFDLHANLSPGIVEALDILVAYHTNPHWDLAPTGFRAGNRLIRALRGFATPVHAWRKLPVVLGGGTTIDFLQPLRTVFRKMKKLERDHRVLTTSFFVVHPFTSARDLGWAVHVTTDGDAELANRLADELADLAWKASQTPLPEMLDVGAALARVATNPWRRLGPVTLVDADDIVGAGAPGGNTHVLQALLADDRGLRALVPIHDPAAFTEAWAADVGTELAITIRGTPGYDQPEVPVVAKVAAKADTELGRRVRLDVGSVQVAVAEVPPLPIHPRFWRELGVAPRSADLMVQKNFFHYRIFHIALSFAHIPVISRGATSLRLAATRALTVPSRPAVELGDWRDGDRLHRGLASGT
ncbi:M81 family metallopeptidase [Myxococcota bacterium]|nr:M81 family metallopeptidase [Myxococcota bacterium]